MERFGRELAALRLLAELDLRPPVAPKLLAWDTTTRLFLLEDLGDRGLATALLGKERAAAHAALIDYAAALGRLHAATIGNETRALAIRRELAVDPADPGGQKSLQRDAMSFRQLCDGAGIPVEDSFDDDVLRVQTLLAASGPFRALTHGDPCPDNERRIAGGVAFLDFEASGFNHALLDASYLVMAFPTCWCVGALPPEILDEGQTAYRLTLAERAPEAADEATFSRHLLHASARWLLSGDSLVPRALRGSPNQLTALLGADWPWGSSTARQRFLHRLHAFTQLSRTVGELDGLAATAHRLHCALASRWPSHAQGLAGFPAFNAN